MTSPYAVFPSSTTHLYQDTTMADASYDPSLVEQRKRGGRRGSRGNHAEKEESTPKIDGADCAGTVRPSAAVVPRASFHRPHGADLCPGAFLLDWDLDDNNITGGAQ